MNMHQYARLQAKMSQHSIRKAWARKQQQVCHYCKKAVGTTPKGTFGGTSVPMTVDHAQPTSRGGKDIPENWRVCCLPCNKAKANMTEAEFTAHVETTSKEAGKP